MVNSVHDLIPQTDDQWDQFLADAEHVSKLLSKRTDVIAGTYIIHALAEMLRSQQQQIQKMQAEIDALKRGE